MADFVQREAERREPWSFANCGLLTADWVWKRTGSDPFAAWRGWASVEANARRLSVKRAGGLPRLIERVARGAGLQFTREPQSGDIAVIRLGIHAVGAVRSGDFWIMRLESGIASIRASRHIRVIGAWRVP